MTTSAVPGVETLLRPMPSFKYCLAPGLSGKNEGPRLGPALRRAGPRGRYERLCCTGLLCCAPDCDATVDCDPAAADLFHSHAKAGAAATTMSMVAANRRVIAKSSLVDG
jgi:hypothetical protein